MGLEDRLVGFAYHPFRSIASATDTYSIVLKPHGDDPEFGAEDIMVKALIEYLATHGFPDTCYEDSPIPGRLSNLFKYGVPHAGAIKLSRATPLPMIDKAPELGKDESIRDTIRIHRELTQNRVYTIIITEYNANPSEFHAVARKFLYELGNKEKLM